MGESGATSTAAALGMPVSESVATPTARGNDGLARSSGMNSLPSSGVLVAWSDIDRPAATGRIWLPLSRLPCGSAAWGLEVSYGSGATSANVNS
jgi:hypothetical protein